MHVCAHDIEAVGIGEVFLYVSLGDLGVGSAFLVRLVDDLVVYIREVLHERHVISAPDEISAERVEGTGSASVANMYVVVNCGTAGVDLDPVAFLRDQLLDFSGKRVEYSHKTNLLKLIIQLILI